MLRPLNVSMGLMLENVSPRLRGSGGVHQWAPDKDPARAPAHAARGRRAAHPVHDRHPARHRRDAGGARAEPVAIRDVPRALRPYPGSDHPELPRQAGVFAMAAAPEPDALDMARTIATARLVLGPTMNVQAPPNLSPHEIELFLRGGHQRLGRHFAAQQGLRQPRGAVAAPRAAGRRCARAGFRLARAPRDLSRIRQDDWVDPGFRAGARPAHGAEIDGGCIVNLEASAQLCR